MSDAAGQTPVSAAAVRINVRPLASPLFYLIASQRQ